MKIFVRVELITDWGDANTIEVGRIDRPGQTLDPESVGLSLADGKHLLHNLQQAVIPAQADEVCCLRRICRRCHRWTALKDYRQRKVDTVFGTAPVQIAGPVETPLINMDTLSIENDSIPDGGRSRVPEPESGE